MDMVKVLQDYGWVAVLVLFLADKLWPFFVEHVFPQQIKQREAKDKLAEEERKRIWSLEERRVRSMETVSDTVRDTLTAMTLALKEQSKDITNALSIQNERVSQLQSLQIEHADFTVRAIGDMRAQTGVTSSPRSKRKAAPPS